MFCEKCGQELKEGWVNCPNCGAEINNGNKENNPVIQPITNNYKTRTRAEIKEELLGKAFQEKGSVVLLEGANGISKDLVKVLEPGEKIVAFYYARRMSLIALLKKGRMFRNYIVCTNRRLIYIEGIRPLGFRMFTFLETAICIPYNEITEVQSYGRTGIYSGELSIKSKDKTRSYAVSNQKIAVELEEFLNQMKERQE